MASTRTPNAREPEIIEHGFVLVDGRTHDRGDGGGGGGMWRQNSKRDGRLCSGATGTGEDTDDAEVE